MQSYAATSYEDSKESLFVQVDCSQLEQNEHSEKDGESTSLTEAPAADTIESTLIMEEAQSENHIKFLQAATEDVKAFAPSQDTKTSSTEEQIQTVDPEDISRDKTIENTIDASGNEKTLEVQVKSYNQLISTTPTLLNTYLNNKLASIKIFFFKRNYKKVLIFFSYSCYIILLKIIPIEKMEITHQSMKMAQKSNSERNHD